MKGYIGLKKIISTKESKRKTYLGNKVIEVTFKGGETKEYPEEMLKAIVTDESKDLTSLQEIMVKPVAEKVLMLLTESELTVGDIVYLLQTKVPYSIETNIAQVYQKLWGKEKYGRIFPEHLNKLITLMDVETKLRKKL